MTIEVTGCHDIEYELINKPYFVKSCTITVFNDGKILLNWIGFVGESRKEIGETGFFLTIRSAKMYVTKNISSGKSIWKVLPAKTRNDNN